MSSKSSFFAAPAMAAAALLLAAPAPAADVTFTTSLLNSCVLTLDTSGRLAASSDGTTLGSEISGGSAATMAVVAIGAAPRITFSAPTLSGPSGWGGGATTQIRYTSSRGTPQAYTSASSTQTLSGLLDLFTVNARVQSANGFDGGSYTVTSIATCQQ